METTELLSVILLSHSSGESWKAYPSCNKILHIWTFWPMNKSIPLIMWIYIFVLAFSRCTTITLINLGNMHLIQQNSVQYLGMSSNFNIIISDRVFLDMQGSQQRLWGAFHKLGQTKSTEVKHQDSKIFFCTYSFHPFPGTFHNLVDYQKWKSKQTLTHYLVMQVQGAV